MTIKKILLVDDSKTELHFLSDVLAKRGYSVRTAENGEEAMRRLGEIGPAGCSEEVALLQNECRARTEEIEMLGGEIRAETRSGLSLDVIAKVTRLLELQPAHAEARQLVERLCGALERC